MLPLLQQIRDCLTPETREQLCLDPPEKSVLIGIKSYSLLLINKGKDERRTDDIVEAIRSEVGCPNSDYPFVVAERLSLDDAFAFQMAMACGDCITAFVDTDVVVEAPTQVFRQLHSEVIRSPEFALVDVEVSRIPQTDEGLEFSWLFFGVATGLRTPITYRMFRKKARLLGIWAAKIGAEVNLMSES